MFKKQNKPSDKDAQLNDLFSIRKPTIFAVVSLILLSTISKWKIGEIEFEGGPTFAVLAALLLMWPIIKQIAVRGGSTEFLGLKLQINKLEKHTEQEIALRIEELQSDIEELRKLGGANKNNLISDYRDPNVDNQAIVSAIDDYRLYKDINDWKARVDIDKKLTSGVGRLPLNDLENLLAERNYDQETSMAVAVSLGLSVPGDDEITAIKTLTKLLESPFERVRYRAIKSIERRARRSDTSKEAREIMHESILAALKRESTYVVIEALNKSLKVIFQ